MVTYTPHKIDTSNIHLNEDLINLVDFLAKNTHENWANERIKDGWTYGQKRNDIKKEHPCLVSYEALPESEKEHDRVVVKELLKTIVLLGFRIEKEKSKD